uniref:Meckel syndrome type 1 protein homolog n=1 Tax=Saccoglossus kowalevskii TaxID=10224 RepID=A0ABM0MFP1_SACKO|nr:PREDICTED: Meckel syndrome type 1 protein homolog [Saccoglossus kowalevskii]
MADVQADTGVAHYRSRDPIKNLRIKVTFKPVTSSSLVPTASLPSTDGGRIQDLNPPNHQQPQECETYTIRWQEKLFSKREVELYRDEQNCFSALDYKYHEEVIKLEEKGGRPTNRLFTYVDHDRFTDIDDRTTMMTTSPNEKPTWLAERVRNVRQRRVKDRGGREGENAMLAKLSPIINEPSEEFKLRTHFINTPFQAMRIMADLSAKGTQPEIGEEYLLCTIKVDVNGVISVKPDFNRHRPAYITVTSTAKRDAYEYTLQHVSKQMSREEQNREMRMNRELYSRHVDFMTACVGHEFEGVPNGVLRMLALGEIVSARNYEYDNLYIHYFIELPRNWSVARNQQLSGISENVAYFCCPFEFDLLYHNDDITEDDKYVMPHWPQLFVEVLSLDSWQRYRTEGYGYIDFPNTSGTHELEIKTWRPQGNSLIDEMRRFFIGGSPELEDPTYTAVPTTHEGEILSKFGFKTETTGSVKLRINILQQSQVFMESQTSKRKVGSLIDRLGGLSMQHSVQSVLELFQKARKKMQAARDSLQTL